MCAVCRSITRVVKTERALGLWTIFQPRPRKTGRRSRSVCLTQTTTPTSPKGTLKKNVDRHEADLRYGESSAELTVREQLSSSWDSNTRQTNDPRYCTQTTDKNDQSSRSVETASLKAKTLACASDRTVINITLRPPPIANRNKRNQKKFRYDTRNQSDWTRSRALFSLLRRLPLLLSSVLRQLLLPISRQQR
jgi:hypothetical protein